MVLRVGVIGHISLDSRADGIAAYLRAFFKYARGAEFLYWGGAEPALREFGDNLVKCYPIGSVDLPGIRIPQRIAIMLALWRLRYQIASQVDVLFVHNSDWVLPFAFSTLRKPIVLLMHGWNPPIIAQTRGWLRYGWLRFSDSLAVRIATKIILVSQEGYEGFCRRYPTAQNKFLHIPTFVDDDFLDAPSQREARHILGISNSPVLLCASRLVPEKQIDKAIAVFAAVKQLLPDAALLVAGDGPERPILDDFAKSLGVSDSIRFDGSVPHERMNLYLAASDFFLLPSKWEGTSIALLEALGLGVPAVVNDVADHRLIIKEDVNGFVVKSNRWDTAAAWIVHRYQSIQTSINKPVPDDRYLASRIVPQILAVLQSTVEQFR